MNELQPAGHVLISRERMRQVGVEGWDSKHDDQHRSNELVRAAIAYAAEAGDYNLRSILNKDGKWDFVWPWSAEWWKPSPDPIRNLVKAGALIAAEIDRLQRKKQGPKSESPIVAPKSNLDFVLMRAAGEMFSSFQKALEKMLGKKYGKSKATKKPAAKKPGKRRKRGAERQAAVSGNRGKRNRKGNSAKGGKAGGRRGGNLVS